MEKIDIFISYKNRGQSPQVALRLYEYLTGKGYKVFWDRKKLSRGEYNGQILDAIVKAKDILVLLEEGSLMSCQNEELFLNDFFCNKEIKEALQKNKKAILPIFLDGFKMPAPTDLPKEIQQLSLLQGMKFRTMDSIENLYDSELSQSGESNMKLHSKPPTSLAAKIAFVLLLTVFALVSWICVIHKQVDPADLEQIFETGRNYYESRDYERALTYFLQAAELGHPSAQCWMGTLYFRGRGVELDMKKAFEWDMKAAQQGHATAQCYVGTFYDKGRFVKQDYSEAAKWYKKSAFQGVADGQYNLGEYYYQGKGGVEQNDTLAFDCFEKSARQGYSKALYRLGCMYEMGRFVEQNPRLAYEYYVCSAYQNYAPAAIRVGMYYENGLTANGVLVKKNEEEAFRWYNKALLKEYPEAYINVARCYEEGIGTEVNLIKADSLFVKAAEQTENPEVSGIAKESLRRMKR